MLLASTSADAWVTILAIYVVPSIIAGLRNVPNKWSVVVVNLFLGWTFVGWVVALAIAARSVPANNTLTR